MDYLIEIGVEELPPKALSNLSEAFTQGILQGLQDVQPDTNFDYTNYTSYAAPRRLALWLKNITAQQEDQLIEKRGPAVAAAFDDDGNPSKAASGFASSCGTTVDQLDRLKTDKGEWLMFRQSVKGKATADLLPGIIAQSLHKLPIPKRMRWGSSDVEFVRPVHWILCIDENSTIECNILGLNSSNTTHGHRFHSEGEITIKQPADYADYLKEQGHIIASFTERRDIIRQQAQKLATDLGGNAVIEDSLLDEVTALVEWPHAIAGNFEREFLDVPQECLISSMQDHQKYFPVVDGDGKLMPHFITISNIDSKDVSKVREGNERVIRPRFSDAMFFWNQDRKQTLASRREATQNIVFQDKLGTLFEKTERVAALASDIAEQLNEDNTPAQRAAELCKCDLISDMVGEFPELQGIMGRYYALHDNEPVEVADAIEEHYQPRYAGDAIPNSIHGKIVALADKIDTLTGIFAINMKPTGSKDPFSLRRAALGVLRIMIEGKLDLDLKQLFKTAANQFPDTINAQAAVDETFAYVMERLRAYYKDQSIKSGIIEAVATVKPERPLDFDRRLHAVQQFSQLDAAESLAAANKRIGNMLKKADTNNLSSVDNTLFEEDAEKTLATTLEQQQQTVMPLFEQGNYSEALASLAQLRPEIDAFFDNVMVMADDEALKNNRLALLAEFRALFLKAADLSCLQ